MVFVSHLGDLTENFDAIEVEWQRADAAMDILDAAGIPNNVAPGNHDLGAGGTTSTTSISTSRPAATTCRGTRGTAAGWARKPGRSSA